MKITFDLLKLSYLKGMLELIPHTKPENIKLIFKTINVSMDALAKPRNDLVKKYCKRVEVEVEGGTKEERWQVIPETAEEYLTERESLIKEIEVEFSPLIYPMLKNLVMEFPNIYIDPQTGQKGLRGEQEIFMYEDVRVLFA